MHKFLDKFLHWCTKLCYTSSIAVFWAGISLNLDALERTISQRQAQQEERMLNKYFFENKVNPYLFLNNLQTQKFKETWPIAQALTHTKEALTKRYPLCSLTTEEISNILLMRNERFRQQVEQEQIKAGKDINNLINTNQVHSTCQQLSKCVLPINSIHPLSLPRCQNIINREYLIIEQTMQENQIISEANLGNNKYRNGDTKDADFDIMHDISQVGTILFESFKPQPELIFYKMPNFDNSKKSQSWSSDTPISPTTQNANITTDSTSQPNSSPQNTPNPQSTTTTSPITPPTLPSTQTPLTEDTSINTFINTTKTPHTTLGNHNHPLFQNLCLPSESTAPSSQNSSTAQTWASSTQLPLGSSTQQQQHQQTTHTTLQNLKNNNLWSPLPPNTNPSWSTNTLPWSPQLNPEDQKKELESCTKKCDDLPFDEKAVCKLQCLCGEISSPEITIEKTLASALNGGKSDKHIITDMMKQLGSEIEEGLTFPIVDAWALRIRFCTIPSKIIQPNTSSKTIYSIAETINELHSVADSLANGGKLTTNQTSHEFLGSTKVASDISKSTSISANLSTKTSPTATTQKELENENKLAYDQLLNSTKPQHRNSYILQAYHSPSSSSSQNSIKPDNSPQAPSPNSDPIDITKTLTTQNIGHTNDTLANFLIQNKALLDTLHTALETMDATLAGLKNKK